MKRLALYVFWEKEGFVREHVLYYLDGLKKVAEDIFLIANGKLVEEGENALKAQGVNILKRENIGLDFSAWKTALEYVGAEKLAEYDELILCNCSCYGPIYPFSEMFGVMQTRSCDFWGICRQPDVPGHLIGPRDAKFQMKEHIQSYFYVFRRKALESSAFRRWWDELTPSLSYWDEVREHEMRFSPWLEEQGLVGETFLAFEKYRCLAPKGNATFVCPDVQLIEDRDPLVKRKLIFTSCEVAVRVLQYIRDYTEYPVDLILADLERNTDCSLFAQVKACILATLTWGKRRMRYASKVVKFQMLRRMKSSRRSSRG